MGQVSEEIHRLWRGTSPAEPLVPPVFIEDIDEQVSTAAEETSLYKPSESGTTSREPHLNQVEAPARRAGGYGWEG